MWQNCDAFDALLGPSLVLYSRPIEEKLGAVFWGYVLWTRNAQGISSFCHAMLYFFYLFALLQWIYDNKRIVLNWKKFHFHAIHLFADCDTWEGRYQQEHQIYLPMFINSKLKPMSYFYYHDFKWLGLKLFQNIK